MIGRCLASVQNIVDEMIIVDTGSTDRTIEIAKSFGATVIESEWKNDFSEARNKSLDASTSDWNLILDADEELADGAANLLSLMKDRFYDGYYVRIVTAPSKEEAGQTVNSGWVTRLMRNRPSVRFRRRIHEQPTIPRDKKTACELSIIHFGPFVKEINRGERNTALLEAALGDDPSDGYLWSKLGDEYLAREDYQEAAEAYTKSNSLSKGSGQTRINATKSLALCLFMLQDTSRARSHLLDLIRQYGDYTDLYFLQAQFEAWSGHALKAEHLLLQCLKMGDAPAKYESWGGTGSWRAASLLDALRAASRR